MHVYVPGGTPYSDVQNADVSSRVIHGLRLPQLPFIGDVLYNLMLLCWQVDLDERPSFSQIIAILEDTLNNQVILILNAIRIHFHNILFAFVLQDCLL